MPVVINGSTGISGVDGSAGTPAFQGSDTNTGIRFGTDIVSLVTGGSDRLYIDSSGRLGVGTTSPAQRLQVGDFSGSNVITIGAGTTSSSAIYFSDGNSGTEAYRGYIEYYHASDALLIGGAGLERARIDGSGRLLVGTSSSLAYGDNLQVVSAAAIYRNNTASVGGPNLNFHRSRTGIVSSGDILGNISFQGDDGTDLLTAGGSIKCEVDGTPGADDMPGRLVFSTTADGASSPTERMRITNSGNVGIGSTAPYTRLDLGTTLSAQKLSLYADATYRVGFGVQNSELREYTHTNGIISFGEVSTSDQTTFTEWARYAGGDLLIGYTTDNGAYKLQVNSQIFATSATIATSDGRYKENVATLDSCVDLIKALHPVSFTWKPQQNITRIDEDGNQVLVREGHNFPNGTQVGFIAQEVQEALAEKPWLTSVIKQNIRPAVKDEDGNELAPEEEFLGIAEGNLIAVLTSALQEAIERIETLEAKFAALKAQ